MRQRVETAATAAENELEMIGRWVADTEGAAAVAREQSEAAGAALAAAESPGADDVPLLIALAVTTAAEAEAAASDASRAAAAAAARVAAGSRRVNESADRLVHLASGEEAAKPPRPPSRSSAHRAAVVRRRPMGAGARPAPEPAVRRVNTMLVVAAVLSAVASIDNPWIGVGFMAIVVAVRLVRALNTLASLVIVYAAVVFLIPSRFSAGVYGLTVPGVLALVIAMMWALGRLLPNTPVRRRREPVAVATTAFFVAMIASYAISHLQPLSGAATAAADRNMLILLAFSAITLAVVDGVRTEAQVHRLVGVIVAGAAVTAVIGVLQFLFQLDIATNLRVPGFGNEGGTGFIYRRAGLNRVAGTARHPIEMGVVWAAVVPMGLYLAAHALTRARRQWTVLATGLIAMAVAMALSRSAVGALVVGLLILVPTWTPRRRFRVVAGSLVVVGLMVVAFPALFTALGDTLTGEVGAGSLEGRDRSREEAAALAAESPWIGKGYGTYVPGDAQCETGEHRETCVIDNLYYVLLIEIGWLGMLGFIGVAGVGVLVAVGIRRRSPGSPEADLAQALAATIVAVMVAGWGLNHLRYPMLASVLFLALGLIGALNRMSSRRAVSLPGEETADQGMASSPTAVAHSES